MSGLTAIGFFLCLLAIAVCGYALTSGHGSPLMVALLILNIGGAVFNLATWRRS